MAILNRDNKQCRNASCLMVNGYTQRRMKKKVKEKKNNGKDNKSYKIFRLTNLSKCKF